jgi:uncharacterized protein (DUF3084 family)
MQDINWSAKEKQVARKVFEGAASIEEKELLEHFKQRAASLQNMQDLSNLQREIQDAEREYQRKYDFRYAQLIVVFGRLLREGRISVETLSGLNDEKLSLIRRIAAL